MTCTGMYMTALRNINRAKEIRQRSHAITHEPGVPIRAIFPARSIAERSCGAGSRKVQAVVVVVVAGGVPVVWYLACAGCGGGGGWPRTRPFPR